jgi:transaldolase
MTQAEKTLTLTQPSPEVVANIAAFAKVGVDLGTGQFDAQSQPFWQGLLDVGTELWLDTGDIGGAEGNWASEFSALTTNNTLLNNEIQKGIYDDLINKSAGLLDGVDPEVMVVEIAFILNAHHGLRLAQRFGGKVSVELHTHLSHDIENTLAYARRYYAICPENFIVKIPMTPAGLVATRILRKEGIPINFTLGFSARHNYVAAGFANPSFVNVFLGRCNAYFIDNDLGDGKFVGERATLASQRFLKELTGTLPEPTRQIAASMRGASQVADLAGLDVYTMPLGVAAAALKELDGKFSSQLDVVHDVTLGDTVDPARVRMETLWDASDGDRKFVDSINENVPTTGAEVVDRAHACGAGDIFPRLSEEDTQHIADDGKIPKHSRWADRVQSGEIAIDTLLQLAGLASFTKDQKALDDRIRGIVF